MTSGDVQRATETGIITAEQATELLALAGGRAAGEATTQRSHGVRLAVEIVGYLGAVLVMVGAVTLVGQFWDEMTSWSRFGLVGSLAAGLWAAGAVVDEAADAVQWRLRGFLWLLSSAAVALFAGLLGADAFDWHREPVAVLVGSATAVHAAVLWQLRDRPAQHLACGGGVIAALAGAGAWIDGPGTVGLLLWAFGAVWLVLGWRRIIVPEAVALAGAPALMLVAAAVTGGSWGRLAPIFGLVTAAALFAAGTTLQELLVTGVGVAGVFVFLPMSGAEYFGETIGLPVVLLVSGALLIVVMVALIRRGAGPRPFAH
ncbi:MAG: DUF2157 domain-containing protein [Actinobacteria bacterium]|nr:DUF2157 domain-containing protein [Actinomycetota bacterium]